MGSLEQMFDESDWGQFLENTISPKVVNYEVIKAVSRVNRLDFIPDELKHRAFQDEVIPINKATISQPSLNARMIDMVYTTKVKKRVLEIGTASGLTAAILSNLFEEVHTIEISQVLAEDAKERLHILGYSNISVYNKDGLLGLPDLAPFNGIIVTASLRYIPTTLIEQLKSGGTFISPVGQDDPENSQLIFGVKQKRSLFVRPMGGVYFMPIMSDQEGGWTEKDISALKERKVSFYKEQIIKIADKLKMSVLDLYDDARKQLAIDSPEEVFSDDDLNEIITVSLRRRGLII